MITNQNAENFGAFWRIPSTQNNSLSFKKIVDLYRSVLAAKFGVAGLKSVEIPSPFESKDLLVV